MSRIIHALAAAALAATLPGSALALGGTELEHVARRLAIELGTELRPADFAGPGGTSPFQDADSARAWLLGRDGREGLLLLSTPGMGHALEPAEVPGHGGELLRLPQLVVGVRRIGGDLPPLCGAAVLEMQLDPHTRVPHATGLRALIWAELEEFPQACGELRRFAPQPDGGDALVYELPVRDLRQDAKDPALYNERAVAKLEAGAFWPIGEPSREDLASLPLDRPLLLECRGVDDCLVVERRHDDAAGSTLVREIGARLPEVRVLESDSGWGWTRVRLEGPRRQVDRFLKQLQDDERSGSLNAELVLRSGELAQATIRFRQQER